MSRLELVRRSSGAVCLVFFVLLVLSGWALAANYAPSSDEAFSSLLFIRQDLAGGAALLSAHYYLTIGLVVAGAVFLSSTVLVGQHVKRPHGWWLALGLYLLILGIAFTGYLLPMDQDAYWGTVVRLGIVDTIPIVGPSITALVRGGSMFNASTLPRFYILHVAILPTLVLLFAWPLARAAIVALREPRRRLGWLALVLVALTAVYVVATSTSSPLELRADATSSEYVPRPEWYFLWLFQLGKYVERAPWIQSLLVPLLGVAVLFALPLMRRQRFASRVVLVAGWSVVWTVLTGLALWEDRDLPPKLPYEAAIAARSAVNYENLCYECHGPEGRGQGPQSLAFDLDSRDFTSPEFWRESSEIELRRAIRDGKGKDMPGFGRQLTPDEIDGLLSHIRHRFAPSED